MESLLDLSASPSSVSYNNPNYIYQSKLSLDATIIQATLADGSSYSAEHISFDFESVTKGITISAKEIVAKLNALLKKDLPDGIESLKPEEVTPEATADKIVSGVTALYDVYAKQNPNLSGEELLNRFLETIKSGIKEGYEDAIGILETLGAFSFEGVKEGVEKTKQLIEEKLLAYENHKRAELGLEPKGEVKDSAASSTKNSLLAAAGGTLNLVA